MQTNNPSCIYEIFYGSRLAQRIFSEQGEDELVQVLPSVVKPKLAFLQVEVKCVFLQPPKTYKPCFGVCPKALYTVDVCVFIGKFVVPMLNPKMLLVSYIHQTIVPAPTI